MQDYKSMRGGCDLWHTDMQLFVVIRELKLTINYDTMA